MKLIGRPSGTLGANCYVAIDTESRKGFMVDPGGYSSAIHKAIEDEGVELVYIILTHAHSDHIEGVPEYQRLYPNVKLVCSEAELPMLQDARANFTGMWGGKPLTLTPDVLVKEGDLITVGNMSFLVLATPGHTPGGICLYGEGVLFSGDTLFRGSIGRTDFPGGSYAQLIDSIERKLYTLPDDTRVFPGHEGETNIGWEKKHNPFVTG